MNKKQDEVRSNSRNSNTKSAKSLLPLDPTYIDDFERGNSAFKANLDDSSHNEQVSSEEDENDYMDQQTEMKQSIWVVSNSILHSNFTN